MLHASESETEQGLVLKRFIQQVSSLPVVLTALETVSSKVLCLLWFWASEALEAGPHR